MKMTTLLASLLLAGNLVCPMSVSATNNTAVVSKITTNPTMPSLNNLYACDDNYDGFAVFNLTTQTPIILAAQSSPATNYSVNYYLSQADANAATNPIATPSAYTNTSNQQVIYVRIQLNGTTQYAIGVFALLIQNVVIPTFTPIGQLCQDDTAPVLQTTSNNSIPGTWSPASINTSIPGANTYVFTPSLGQCSTNITMTVFVSPSPDVSNLPTLMKVCDNDAQPNDTYTTYNITNYIGYLPDCTINYYIDANLSQPILNPSSFINTVASTQTIFLTITNNNSGCIKYSTLTLCTLPIPTPNTNPTTIEVCDTNNDGFEIVDITQNYSYISNGDIYVSLHYFRSINDAFSNSNEILNPTSASVNSNVWIRVENDYFIDSSNDHCYTIVEQPIQLNPVPSYNGNGYTIVNNSGFQTLTIDYQSGGVYSFSLDGGLAQTSPVFQNVSVGTHSITITDLSFGCTTIISNIDVNLTGTPPPTGSTSQSFSPGATLADILVIGQNIQWYSNSSGSFVGGNTVMSALPMNTTLVDNTTYYASQKIGGYESTTRLPVTVHLALNNATFEHNHIRFSPNPVKDQLYLENPSAMENITIYTLAGQTVLELYANATSQTVDVSAISSGIYFVKVTSNSNSQVFKIVKE